MSGMNLKIGLLILSGDLTTRADTGNLINIGLPFLKELTEILKIDRDQVIIIPGNHDIPLKDSNFHYYSHETAFKLFLEKFYDDDTKEITGIDKFILPGDKLIDILRINSARLRKKEEMNYGYVEWYYYKNLLNKLIDQDSKSLKIAAMHHHLVSVPYEENLDPDYPEGGISITLDSGRVIEGLQKFGFKCVLHGHQHLPGITKIARGRTPIDSSLQISGLEENLYIMASGSAGVIERRFSSQMKYNSYSILKILDDKIELQVRQYNPHIAPTTYYSTIINI
jgi:3',5'-cyclic AMP phosphodiesterase CpdA